MSPTLSFEGGGEAAFNYRDQSNSYSENNLPVPLVRLRRPRRGAARRALRPGRLAPQRQVVARGRHPGRAVHHHPVGARTSKERSFTYPKPRFLATWSPTKEDQVRLRIEREVGQLNFGDFASSVSLNSNVLTAGNSDLRPDKTWVYELAFEKHFWDNGAVVLTLRHEDITDVIDVFPFRVPVDANNDGVQDDLNPADGIPDTQLVSGPGNIGDGKNDVIIAQRHAAASALRSQGRRTQGDLTYQDSEVHDPTTGQTRRISGQRPDDVNVSFRQDLPDLKLTYGVNFYAGWRERHYLPQEIQLLDLRSFWGSFLEYKPTPNFTLRGEINNFSPYQFDIIRRIYNNTRDIGALREVENEHRDSQVIIELSARWTLG